MNKYKSDYFKPYIRRVKKGDESKASDVKMKLYLSIAEELHINYVMIHGDCGIVDVGSSKKEIKHRVPFVSSNKEFNSWANKVKNLCQEW